MTTAEEYAQHCVALSYDDLPGDVLTDAKKLLLDTFGNAVGGYHWANSGDAMLGGAAALAAGDGAGSATVLATGDRLSPANVALANGALAHSLDYDNHHARGNLHVGSSVITAAVAAAEANDADGERLLEGVVAGYDVACRLGMALNPRSSHELGFHPTGLCGTFGATAAVGVVTGLSTDELEHAFAINGSQASGSYQSSVAGGWNKRLHPGLAAHDAFVAVGLAENGFRGARAPIEGELGFLQAYAARPLPDRATEGLGDVYEITNTTIKPYPLGRFTHVPIALLIELLDEEGLSGDEIESIEIEMPTSGAAVFGRSDANDHPTEPVEAQFDMPFGAALAVAYDRVGLPAFHDALEGEYTAEFARLMSITRTVGDEEMEALHPESWPARVTVRTGSESYSRYREWVEGEPDHPMSWDALRTKFEDLAAALDDAKRTEIAERTRDADAVSGRALLEPFRT